MTNLLSFESIKPPESEFIAEETLIAVTSNVNHPQFRFITGIFGPLEAGLPCQLPLWLAITLRKKGKCTISIPDWMSIESLEKFIQNEREEMSLEPLHFHYMEIARLLLSHAREDIASPDKVSSLLQDLENIRMDRMKLSIAALTETVKGGDKVYVAKVTNISSMEVYSIKGFIKESLSIFRQLTTTKDDLNIATGRNMTRKSFEDADYSVAANNDEVAEPKKLRKFRNSDAS